MILAVLAGIFVVVMSPGWALVAFAAHRRRKAQRPGPAPGAALLGAAGGLVVCCAVSALVGGLLARQPGLDSGLPRRAGLMGHLRRGRTAADPARGAGPPPGRASGLGAHRRRVGTMIPELHLADPTRCPSCSAPLTPERDACRACGLRLTGPLAQQLWQVSVQAAELLDRRSALIAQMRREPAAARARAAPRRPPTSPPAAAAGTCPTPPRVVPPQGAEPAPRPGRRAARRRRRHLPGRLLGPARRRRPLGRDGGRDRAGRRGRRPHPPCGPDLDRRVALAAHRRPGGAGLLRRPGVGPGRARRRRRRALLGRRPDGRGGPHRAAGHGPAHPGPPADGGRARPAAGAAARGLSRARSRPAVGRGRPAAHGAGRRCPRAGRRLAERLPHAGRPRPGRGGRRPGAAAGRGLGRRGCLRRGRLAGDRHRPPPAAGRRPGRCGGLGRGPAAGGRRRGPGARRARRRAAGRSGLGTGVRRGGAGLDRRRVRRPRGPAAARCPVAARRPAYRPGRGRPARRAAAHPGRPRAARPGAGGHAPAAGAAVELDSGARCPSSWTGRRPCCWSRRRRCW